MVSNVSAEMILGFIKYHGKKKVTLEEMFKSLSLEMGGDGKTITKKQLDEYVRKAEAGLINISKTKLQALKKMQENWDNISKDGNNLTFADFKGFPTLLVDAAVGDFEDSDKDKKKDTFDNTENSKIYKFNIDDLKQAMGVSENNEITKSDVESYLQSVLSVSSDDDSSSDLVDSLTNLIANFSVNTTVEKEA